MGLKSHLSDRSWWQTARTIYCSLRIKIQLEVQYGEVSEEYSWLVTAHTASAEHGSSCQFDIQTEGCGKNPRLLAKAWLSHAFSTNEKCSRTGFWQWGQATRYISFHLPKLLFPLKQGCLYAAPCLGMCPGLCCSLSHTWAGWAVPAWYTPKLLQGVCWHSEWPWAWAFALRFSSFVCINAAWETKKHSVSSARSPQVLIFCPLASPLTSSIYFFSTFT